MNLHFSEALNEVFFDSELTEIAKIFSARAFGARDLLVVFLVGKRA